MKRPDGVTMVSIYCFVAAGFSLLGVCAVAALPFIVMAAAQSDPDARPAVAILGAVAIVGGIATLFWAALNAAVGWGLWRMQPWARWAAIVLAALGLLSVPIGTVIGALILWYLFQPEARRAFGETLSTPSAG